ncbi:UNKNOWN [Stylonychia lemnae]|uniref:Uncharacterized protein n=1 Tax=Stylonychia lemnae TaxID=5949 RepID=A0A078AMH7_STYLE|nr:UNKNOWN [Stylonychia lemnae]|eukprot:CDW83121.1 UNKNOWN [Stylonychia lemnae]
MRLRDFMFEIEMTKVDKRELQKLMERKLDADIFWAYNKRNLNSVMTVSLDNAGAAGVASKLMKFEQQFIDTQDLIDELKQNQKKYALQTELQSVKISLELAEDKIKDNIEKLDNDQGKISNNITNMYQRLENIMNKQQTQNDQLTKLEVKNNTLKNQLELFKEEYKQDKIQFDIQKIKRSGSFSGEKGEVLADPDAIKKKRNSLQDDNFQKANSLRKQQTMNRGGIDRKELLVMQKKFDEQINIVRQKIIEVRMSNDSKIEWLYKDQKRLAQDLKYELTNMVNDQKDVINDLTKRVRTQYERIEGIKDDQKDLKDKFTEFEQRFTVDYLNSQAKKLIRDVIDNYIEQFKIKTNTDIKYLKKHLAELESWEEMAKQDINQFKKEMNALRSKLRKISFNVLAQSIFEIQNKNEEINSYLREMTRLRKMDHTKESILRSAKEFYDDELNQNKGGEILYTNQTNTNSNVNETQRSIASPEVSVFKHTREPSQILKNVFLTQNSQSSNFNKTEMNIKRDKGLNRSIDVSNIEKLNKRNIGMRNDVNPTSKLMMTTINNPNSRLNGWAKGVTPTGERGERNRNSMVMSPLTGRHQKFRLNITQDHEQKQL